MNKVQVNNLAVDLRAILALMQLVQYRIEGIKTNPLVPSLIKNDLNTVLNAHNRFIRTVAGYDKSGTWLKIKAEMTSEKVHDLSLLIDESMNVENLGEVVEVIKSSKTPVYGDDTRVSD